MPKLTSNFNPPALLPECWAYTGVYCSYNLERCFSAEIVDSPATVYPYIHTKVPTKRERGMNQRLSFCLRKEPGKGDYLLESKLPQNNFVREQKTTSLGFHSWSLIWKYLKCFELV